MKYEDALAAHRAKMVYPMAIVTMVALVPFCVNNFLQGRSYTGLAILAVILAFGVDALAIRRQRRPPIPFWMLLVPMAVAIVLAVVLQGIYGALWTYPLLLFCYFVLPWRLANLSAAGALVATTLLVHAYVDPNTAVRVFATLALTIILINIILNVILRLQSQLMDQAITDPLTGAFNRRYMESRLEDLIERHKRSGAAACALVIDIDDFKRINDERGHKAGDDVLQGLVRIIGAHSRKVDLLFRSGGEEFLLLLPDTREAEGMIAAEKLRDRISAAPIAGAAVTASIGVAEYRGGESLDDWIRRADQAMYLAKRAGRNRVSVYLAPVAA